MTSNLSFLFEDKSITSSSFATPVFGLEERVKELEEKLLRAPRLGITGIGGIGKTTLAHAVFDVISKKFEYTCFLEEMKEREEKMALFGDNLRAEIASRLYYRGHKVPSYFKWHELERKRVLIILDGAEYQSQVQVMTETDAFSRASRVIVTARDKKILVQEGFEIYEAQKLGLHESEMLLCAHAFKTTVVPIGFESRVTHLVEYCEHLPLTLKVAGACLFHSNETVWDHLLKNLGCSLPLSWTTSVGSTSILTASYLSMALTERELFWYIATYFHGEKLEEIQKAWTLHEWAGWQTLLDKCFVGVSYQDGHLLIWLHEILREFGRVMAKSANITAFDDVKAVNEIQNQHATQVRVLKIVQYDHGEGPPFLPLDIGVVLGLEQLRTLWLEGVYVDHITARYDRWSNRIQFLKVKCFPSQEKSWHSVISYGIFEIQSLRCMIVDGITALPKSLNSLQALQYLNISNCEVRNFHPDGFAKLRALEHLTICNCRGITELPISITQLGALRHLRIEGCRDLTALPESWGQLNYLEQLSISGCPLLTELSLSIKALRKLRIQDFANLTEIVLPGYFNSPSGLENLNISSCPMLRNLPSTSLSQLASLRHLRIEHCGRFSAIKESFGLLRGLEHLIISNCSALHRFPESFGKLEGLRHLELLNCGRVTGLPDSFGLLRGLEHLIISNCSALGRFPLSFRKLEGLRHLELLNCGCVTRLPDSFGRLRGLEHLIISNCSLHGFPESFGELEGLRHLEIHDCMSLMALPDSFGQLRGLTYLSIRNCRYLQTLPKSFGRLVSLEDLEIQNCKNLTAPSESLPSLIRFLVNINDCPALEEILSAGPATRNPKNQDFEGPYIDPLSTVESSSRTEDLFVIPGKGKGMEKDDPEHSEKDAGSIGAKQIGPSQILCAEDLIREVKEAGEDGYLLSLKWFLGLQENERDSLMSIMRKAGYLKLCETSTTMLFERIGNDVQNRTTHNDAPSSATKHGAPPGHIQQVGEPQKGDPMLRISEGKGLGFDSNDDTANACGSDNLAESNMYGTTDVRLKSVIAELKSDSHDSYCVSSEWLSRLEDYEKQILDINVLEAGYAKTYQTGKTTSFERMRDHVGHPASAVCDGPSDPSNRNDAVGIDTRNRGVSSSSDSLLDKELKGNLLDEDNTNSFVGVANVMVSSQDNGSTCRPQFLKVACQPIATSNVQSTPSAQSSGNAIGLSKYSRREQFGDSVVILPKMDESRQISTTIEKPFKLTTVDFSGRGGSATGVISVDLRADVTSIVSCCLKIDQNPSKVRIKFHKISGKVLHQKSNEQQCNGLALSSVRTNVYSGVKSNETDDHSWDEMLLHLDDEYYSHPRRRVLDSDLQWFESSGGPENSEPGSITLWLQGDIMRRCQTDLARNVKTAHILHFQDRRPVIFEGEVPTELQPNSFLEVNIRYELELSYLKPKTSVTREAVGTSCRRTSEIIDFDCCLVITTKKFSSD